MACDIAIYLHHLPEISGAEIKQTEGHLVQSGKKEKKRKKKKKEKKYDSYGKPANLTAALLWPSTAIRFLTRDKRKNRTPTTLPSKSTARVSLEEKITYIWQVYY